MGGPYLSSSILTEAERVGYFATAYVVPARGLAQEATFLAIQRFSDLPTVVMLMPLRSP
jgi:hypothetical protein